MSNKEPQLADLTEDFYAEDPKLGDIVFLRNNFEDATVRGPITGIRRFHPHRGLDAENNYEVVIYQRLKIKVAGIKQWLLIEDGNDAWEIESVVSGPEYNKLPATVVVEQIVDEMNEDEDEL